MSTFVVLERAEMMRPSRPPAGHILNLVRSPLFQPAHGTF